MMTLLNRKTAVFALTLTLLSVNISAQDTLVVQSGFGTLNDAIDTYGGNKIYQLQAGEWYGLKASIQNDGFHLQLIGSEPDAVGGMPATLQTGCTTGGQPLSSMFYALDDITLKQIYFVNADTSGQTGYSFLKQEKKDGRVVIDGCVLHPVGVGACILATGGSTKTYFTNNLAVNFGYDGFLSGGAFFDYQASANGPDTVLVENNTFVTMGLPMLNTGFHLFNTTTNYINWNHNTFVMAEGLIDLSIVEKQYYWTNNLMFDVQTKPFFENWVYLPGMDIGMPMPNLIMSDTLPNEILPSDRPCIVQYNAHYRAQEFFDFVDDSVNSYAEANKLPGAFLFDLVWPADSINCREAQMFNSTDFPRYTYGNTLANVDPQWNDIDIYEHEANLIEGTKIITMLNMFGLPAENFPPSSEWPNWQWIPSGDISENSVWPLFDGTYNDESTLTGSIEGLPLGDLNWFPEAKAAWEENRDIIEAHIKAGNTDRIEIRPVNSTTETLINRTFIMYPNPATNNLTITSGTNKVDEIKIIDLQGRTVYFNTQNFSGSKTIDLKLSKGVYFLKLKGDAPFETQKLIIE
jgi:hypothetical protein